MLNYLILLLGFLFMVLLVFVPGFIELTRPKDPGPIDIDLDRDMDERYFSRSYKNYLKSSLLKTSIHQLEADGGSALVSGDSFEDVVLSMNRGPEVVKVSSGDVHLSNGTDFDQPIVVRGDLTIDDECSLMGELKVDKDLITGFDNRFIAAHADNIFLGSDNTISGWIDADKLLSIEDDCEIEGRATAGERIVINGNGRFKALAAPMISIGVDESEPANQLELGEMEWSPDLDRMIIENFDDMPLSNIAKIVEQSSGKVIAYSNVLLRAIDLGLTKEPLITLDKKQRPAYFETNKIWLQCGETFRIRGDASIPADERLAGNLIFEGDLKTSTGVYFEGSVHVGGSASLGAGTVVQGSLICGGDLMIGNNCYVAECVYSKSDIKIKAGTSIGKDSLGGVAGENKVFIERFSTIQGKVYGEDGIEILSTV